MLRKCMAILVVVLVVSAILNLVSPLQESVACDLRSEGGVEIQISIVVSDDSAVDYVRGRVVNRQGRKLAGGISLGFTQGPIDCSALGIYESRSGDVVALFHRAHDRSLMLLVDLRSGRVFPSDEANVDREIHDFTQELADDLKIPLNYEGPYAFNLRRFL